MPKGVVLKKDAVLNNVRKVIKYTNIGSSDALLLSLPLSYSYGMSQTLCHLLAGGRIVFSRCNLSPRLILSEIDFHRITNYAATPYFYEAIVKINDEEKINLIPGALKFFMNAGGYLSPDIIEKMVHIFRKTCFINNYGQTEAAPRLSYAMFNADGLSPYSGVGKPLPGVSFLIQDEQGHILKDGEVGEITYRSEDMFENYYKQGGDFINSKSYFFSGDFGFFDKTGNLNIVGRKDSMIKLNGRKLYLSAIEEKLKTSAHWHSLRLKKESHPSYGEYICAHVIPVNESEDQKEIIKNFMKLHLAQDEMPKKIIFCSSFSVSSNGKIILNRGVV
jgi:acyl-CoA synthetase (AMP-forming)/AMP-acid ligase II